MRDVVVDACVAVKWFVQEPGSAQARTLFDTNIRRLAPDFLMIELANAFWKNVRLGRMSRVGHLNAVGTASKFFWSLLPASKVAGDALDLAIQIDLPVYDCLYVIVARQSNAPLVTTDIKLVGKLAGTPDAANVILLADWKP